MKSAFFSTIIYFVPRRREDSQRSGFRQLFRQAQRKRAVQNTKTSPESRWTNPVR